ncbi:MAG: hypothetical protein WB510_15530 [Candidatus Sulfotelmatobacter sp.]
MIATGTGRLAYGLLLLCVVAGCETGFPGALGAQPRAQAKETAPSARSPAGNELTIETAALPETHPRGRYEVRLEARGGVPSLHWKVEKGVLPAGIKLNDDGVLRGEAERAGEYRVVIAVRDSGNPQQGVQKEFVIEVVEAMTLVWKTPAHVTGNRIDGSVEVSNTTSDDMGLTFYVLAVAEDGRATAIGYQHFVLHRGTTGMELPFGETLPHGAYVVHVDAVGEIEEKDLIYRERLQTPGALRVTVGP